MVEEPIKVITGGVVSAVELDVVEVLVALKTVIIPERVIELVVDASDTTIS